jgi:hypothetical protein
MGILFYRPCGWPLSGYWETRPENVTQETLTMRTNATQRQEIADHYAGKFCTLDGRPARIIGRAQAFATVYTTDCDNDEQVVEHEWSWAAVAHIMRDNGGRFQS